MRFFAICSIDLLLKANTKLDKRKRADEERKKQKLSLHSRIASKIPELDSAGGLDAWDARCSLGSAMPSANEDRVVDLGFV